MNASVVDPGFPWRQMVVSLYVKQIHITFTAHKRSLGQGNIFRSVCQEFCPHGEGEYLCRYTPRDQVHPPWDQVHPPGPGTPPRTRYTPLHLQGPGTPPSQTRYTPPPGSSACREIRATSGRYASYWNAFLLKIEFSGKKQKKNRFTQNNFFLLKIQQFLGVISVQCWHLLYLHSSTISCDSTKWCIVVAVKNLHPKSKWVY